MNESTIIKPARCFAVVHTGSGFSHPCKNNAKVMSNGKAYCGVHDPARREAARPVREAKARAKFAQWRAEARAPQMKALLEAIRARCPGIHTTDQESGETFATLIDNILEGIDP